ncbi:MAG TPA: hypothetical protein VN258_19720 [Mobilitalea sp.]|nr:hypothetical protein [Mobilitalea sp.]
MEFIYNFRKYIARSILVPFVIILLQAFIFNTWSGSYREGSLEDIVIRQSAEYSNCFLSYIESKLIIKDSVQVKQLVKPVLTGITIGCFLLSLIPFLWISRSILFFERKYTLVSLCVRMDE